MPEYPEGYREFAYVANGAANTVTVLDLVYLRPNRTIDVGSGPVALAVNPKRDEVYAVSSHNGGGPGSVSVIDTTRNEVVATIPVHRNPEAITVDAQGLRAYVSNTGSNTVTAIDLAERKPIATAATGERPGGLAVAPDGRSLVVANEASGTISIFGVSPEAGPAAQAGGPAARRTEPGAAVRSARGNADRAVDRGAIESGDERSGHAAAVLSLRATFGGCPKPASPVILPDSSKVFVACSGGHQVMAVGLAAAPDSWAAKQDAGLMTDHALAMLDVGEQPSHLAMKPDGGEVFATNLGSDTVSEISTTTNEVGSTYPIGNRPTHGVVGADNSALWVAASGTDSISLYSIDDGKFVSSLRTGSGPDALAFSNDEHLLLAADVQSGDVAVIRTQTKLGPALLTILPAGGDPVAIAVKAMAAKT